MTNKYNNYLILQDVRINGRPFAYNVLHGEDMQKIISAFEIEPPKNYKRFKSRTGRGDLLIYREIYKNVDGESVTKTYRYIYLDRARSRAGYAEDEIINNAYKYEDAPALGNDWVKLYAQVYRDGDALEERFRYYSSALNQWRS